MVITKEMVIDTINLANFAYENGFEDLNIVDLKGVEKYNTIFKPKILEFERKHGNTPNMILKNFVKNYIEKKNLSNDFSCQGFHFKGQGKVHTNTWACVYAKDAEDLRKGFSPATQLPQLYFTISHDRIHFGFAYGALVKVNAVQVQKVKENPELLEDIIEYLQRDNELAIAGDVLSDDGSTYERVNLETLDDLILNWSNSVWIGKEFLQSKIDSNIEETITETFDNLLEFFKFASLGNYETSKSRKYWQITTEVDVKKCDEWKKNNIVAIGFQEVIQSAGKEILEMSEDKIRDLFLISYPEAQNSDEGINEIINFLHNMKEGDYVLVDQGITVLGWGIIKSGPKYESSQEFSLYRQVEWISTRDTVSKLNPPCQCFGCSKNELQKKCETLCTKDASIKACGLPECKHHDYCETRLKELGAAPTKEALEDAKKHPSESAKSIESIDPAIQKSVSNDLEE